MVLGQMKRRQFITLLGGAAVAPAFLWPLAARGQQRAKPARIGYLSASSPPDNNFESFLEGMRALGYGEGRDFVLEVRYAGREYGRFPALVDELLRARVDVIVAGGPAFRTAALTALSVPVVFGFSGDPVEAGIVASLARPGGNVTGVSFLSLDLSAKRVELLKEAMPAMTRVAVLANSTHPGEASELKATREAAGKLGIAIEHFEVQSDDSFEPAFAAIAQSKCDGLIAFPDALKNFNRRKIVAFALRRRLPSIYGWKMYAEAGGLMSYGPVQSDAFARLAVYVDKILKGAKPADLPVEQPTKLEMVVNVKTAKALGLEIPPGLILRSDELIE
jgi:putative ABC transport system substrate-binding protein